MADISILDLQNLRHLIGGYDTTHCKNDRLCFSDNRSRNQKIVPGCCRQCNEKQTGTNEIFYKEDIKMNEKNNGRRCTGRYQRRIKNVWRNDSTDRE